MSLYWKIPPEANAAFVAAMEDVLAVCHLPCDPLFPVVCMDESNKQLVGEVHPPIPAAPGHGEILDHEYVRNGVADIFLEIEPLAGVRHVEITARRTRKEWAHFIKGMLDERYPQARKVRLVMDNLNTHSIASLYETFAPAEARRLAERLEIHHTPKHGSPSTGSGPDGWLNIAEIEFSAMSGQCLKRRIPTMERMRIEIAAWQAARNTKGAPVNWQFTTENARTKLTRLYPLL